MIILEILGGVVLACLLALAFIWPWICQEISDARWERKRNRINYTDMKSFREWMKEIESGRPDISSDLYGKEEQKVVPTKDKYSPVVEFHLLIATMCAQYGERMQNMQFENRSDKKEALEKLGFTNSRTYKDIIASEEEHEEAETLAFFKARFPESMFMRLKDFKSLCVRYGLVCGPATEFKGEIPDKNMKEIQDALQIILSKCEDMFKINERYYSFTFMRFGYYVSEDIIAPIRQETKNFHFFHNSDYTLSDDLMNFNESSMFADKRYMKPSEMLIAAPGHNMGEVRIGRQEVPQPTSRLNDDPIVFQMLPHGIVMIHSKWGDEANDPMLKENAL